MSMRTDDEPATRPGREPPRRVAAAGRRSGIPLYYQVMRDLKEQIVSGRLGPGQQLPSEAQLTRQFHVSRVVVRQALQILDEQSLITRFRGKGTYVSEKVAEDATPRITGSLEDLIHMGPEVSIKVVEFRFVRASLDLAEIFACDVGTDLLHIQRIRLVDERPLAVLVNHLPYDVGACISLSDLSKKPLIVLIETLAGRPIEWASQVFEAVAADEAMAGLLVGRRRRRPRRGLLPLGPLQTPWLPHPKSRWLQLLERPPRSQRDSGNVRP
jgi:GntR family transcriptional regulator